MNEITTKKESLILDHLGDLRRTYYCGDLRSSHVGEKVTLMGWVDRRRDLGQLIFVDLRDREGVVQIVFKSDIASEVHAKAELLRPEYVVAVQGHVVARDAQTVNPNIPTGDIEVIAEKLSILNDALTPPFALVDHVKASEDLRLEYRYLDLRRAPMQRNFRLRHTVNLAIRNYLHSLGFLEIETPFLTKSTPEGARDYLVPSRVQPGKFYALPQSPQLFKQLLMISGFDKYFQIVRCFRDEDLRADRQPEFTQVDIEMSFPQRDRIFEMVEGLMEKIFACIDVNVPRPFPRLTYKEAMHRFGSDKPDTRFGMELVNVSELFKASDFRLFREIVEKGGCVKAIVVPQGARYSRKELDDLAEFVRPFGAQGLSWVRLEDTALKSSFPKSVGENFLRDIANHGQATPGDLMLIAAGPLKVVSDSLSALRLSLARKENLVDKTKYNFLWVVDFPLLEYDETEKRFVAMHHPFTSPVDEDFEKLETDPASVRAKAYDLVLNGTELGGGSIRIHRQDHQKAVFRALGIGDREAEEKFGFFLRALQYGTPPHGGIALGVDRMVMLLAGERSLRDVIAFPKVASGSCPLTGSPSEVSPEQLKELKIKVDTD